jgi:hypothetical protein
MIPVIGAVGDIGLVIGEKAKRNLGGRARLAMLGDKD